MNLTRTKTAAARPAQQAVMAGDYRTPSAPATRPGAMDAYRLPSMVAGRLLPRRLPMLLASSVQQVSLARD